MAAHPPPTSSSHRSDPTSSRSRGSTTGSASGSSLRPAPRTLPPWIDSYQSRFGAPSEDQLRSLSAPPPRTLAPQPTQTPNPHSGIGDPLQRRVSRDGFVYENQPSLTPRDTRRAKARLRKLFFKRRDGSERGRKWDHLRSAEPVIVPRYTRMTGNDSPWRGYLQSSRYGRLPNEESEIVEPEWLNQLQPRFNEPVETPHPTKENGNGNGGDGKGQGTRTRRSYKRLWRMMLEHPLIPLAFRLTVLLTSIVALALSAKIYQLEHGRPRPGTSAHSAELTQSVVAIVVDTVAMPYIGYMTWDEYTGKPLGLRKATQKISLVLMDLFFIIFKSASTALAFEALVFHNSADRVTRAYSQALAAFQLVGLISWSFTFTVNVFRLVQKLGGGEDDRG